MKDAEIGEVGGGRVGSALSFGGSFGSDKGLLGLSLQNGEDKGCLEQQNRVISTTPDKQPSLD